VIFVCIEDVGARCLVCGWCLACCVGVDVGYV